MDAPRFLICDPLPSEADRWAGVEIVLCTSPASLWTIDDQNNGSLVVLWPTTVTVDAPALARLAREVGDWYARYLAEEEK